MTLSFEGAAQPELPVGDDAVRPFAVEALDIRGRAIQMGPALDAILARHDYPTPVARLLAEAIVLTVLLGTSLKFDGKFIMQTDGDGPVDLLVVDYRTNGAVRAYARFDRDAVLTAVSAGTADPARLLGSGLLAMTIDQGPNTSRYQGIVPLEGGSLEEVAHTYFRQSEQLPTRVRLAVAEMQTRVDGAVRHAWRAGGMVVQFLPEAPERMPRRDLPGGDAPAGFVVDDPLAEDDTWVEAQSLVATIQDDELTDPAVPVEHLLYRLFSRHGVRVFRPARIRDQCSCSRDKVSGVLATFTAEEIAETIEDGAILATCEFCGERYRFDPGEFAGSRA
jgi:molecular chaperone Hsp33